MKKSKGPIDFNPTLNIILKDSKRKDSKRKNSLKETRKEITEFLEDSDKTTK